MRLAVLGPVVWCAACALVLGAPAAAQDEQPAGGPRIADERTASLYTGLGLSRVETVFSNVSPAWNLDVTAGMFVPKLTWLSGELDLSFTVNPGNNKGMEVVSSGGTPCTLPPTILDPDGTPNGCDAGAVFTPRPGTTATQNELQMTNIGAFAVLRTPGPVYALAKYGYRYINASLPEIQDGDDQQGTAWTAGAGYRFGRALSQIEFAYTDYSSQLEYWGLNFAYGFGASPDTAPN